MVMKRLLYCLPLMAALALAASATQADEPGEAPALTPHIDQQDIAAGVYTFKELRLHGRRVYTTPFNKADGYGDGPINPSDTTGFGGRPTLQDNGTFLRVNGLDAQTCLECHFVRSNAGIPMEFGIGGVAMAAANALIMPTEIDVSDQAGGGYAFYNGRFANPPFNFGGGGVELLGKEMTADLQALKAEALQNPGTVIPLITKGVDFGVIVYNQATNTFDTSGVEGIDPDLVVKPFGRKGEFPTIRSFDIGAVQFHMGMQPVEVVGAGVDGDGDGVVDEMHPGDLSVLSIFLASLERPEQRGNSRQIRQGENLFTSFGCAHCHRPELVTESRFLTLSFPEVPTDPDQNIYYDIDLSKPPARFEKLPGGGLRIPLYADLKRHDMGPELAESTGHPLDREFTTARLWGVADTAPYLHDGRAMTLTEAILLHGGEAQNARQAFQTASASDRRAVLAFLRSLRTPRHLSPD